MHRSFLSKNIIFHAIIFHLHKIYISLLSFFLKFSIIQKYVENVKQDASIGTNILRVSASDEDADNNGAIVYTLSAPYNPNDLEYFEIQPESGWIVLKKPLDVSYCLKVFQHAEFELLIHKFFYLLKKFPFCKKKSLPIIFPSININ